MQTIDQKPDPRDLSKPAPAHVQALIEELAPWPRRRGAVPGVPMAEQLPWIIAEREREQAWHRHVADLRELLAEPLPETPPLEKSMRRIKIRRATGEYVRRGEL